MPASSSGADDLLLVRRALSGDAASIEAVLARLSCIVRFVFRLNESLGYRLPTESLEDVIQQVYAALWPRLCDYTGAATLDSWAFGFCRNCLRAEARRRRGTRLGAGTTALTDDVLDGHAGDRGVSRERDVAWLDGLRALREELDRLPPDERAVVELRHLEEWSFERIARELALPASTVKDRCYRALTKLKARLRRRDVSGL